MEVLAGSAGSDRRRCLHEQEERLRWPPDRIPALERRQDGRPSPPERSVQARWRASRPARHATALQRLDELRAELAAREITLGIARAKLSLNRAFNPTWLAQRRPETEVRRFPTLKAALHAFERHRVGADEAAPHSASLGSQRNELI